MDYKEKYNKALERARALNDGKDVDVEAGTTTCEYIFPELKGDNNNEKIRKSLISFLKSPFVHENITDEKVFPWIDWLEKQNPSWSEKDKNLLNRLIGVLDGTNEEDYHEAWEETFLPWLKSIKERMQSQPKQSEQPTDKIKTKFKEGDYIVPNNITSLEIWKVINIDEDGYYNIYSVTNPEYDEIYRVPGFIIEEDYHLWTIQNAKNGDVLVNGSNIFIFRFINHTRIMGYCHVNINDRKFYDDIGKNECFCLIDAEITPATKEQRNLLFSKMREDRYEWDADKKELKKIEVTNKESEEKRIKQEIVDFITSSNKYGTNERCEAWLNWLEKQGQEPKKVSIWKHWENGIAGNGEGKQVYLIRTGNTYNLSSCLGFECDYIELSELDNLMLEKQGEKDLCIDCTNDKGCVACENGNLKEIKIEQKFKVRDWVVSDNNGEVWQIGARYTNEGQRLYLYNVNDVIMSITLEELNNDYHLWSINDAKDGDVLAYVIDKEDLWIMIYRSLYEPYEGHVHYHALLVNDNFSDKGTCCICIDNLKPATKEQRDLLFEKMKNGGYEWDNKNKKLGLIKQTLKITPKFCVGQVITDDNGTWYKITNIKCLDDWYYELYDVGKATTHLELCSIIDEKFRENRFADEIKKMMGD